MTKFIVDSDERNDLITALNMRINYIETGNTNLSRNDVIQQNAQVIITAGAHHITDLSTTSQLTTVKSLEPSQIETVKRMTRMRSILLSIPTHGGAS